MNTRDQFAAHALQGLLARDPANFAHDNVAEDAYAFADAMMDAREPDTPPPRYPWHKAPEWAQWAATNHEGLVCWFSTKPEPSGGDWFSNTLCDECGKEESLKEWWPEKWETSLEERP